MRIGIMQGRLVPPMEGRFQCFPRGRWAEEFEFASQAGLQAIEWIYDLYGEDVNPLASDEGIGRMRALSAKNEIAVVSVCADYFMERPFVRVTPAERQQSLRKLLWLLSRCRLLGIERMVVPFVDASRIEGAQEENEVVAVLQEALPAAQEAGVELHLETSLAPRAFADFLARLPHANLKANYDSGNSASLGYAVEEELAAYGSRVGSVHIKDRVLHGGTVPLGNGNTSFRALFEGLHKLAYAGDFVLQVARGEPGGEVEWSARNRVFVEQYLASVAAGGQLGVGR